MTMKDPLPPTPPTKVAVKVLLLSIAVPVKLSGPQAFAKSKDKSKVVPDMVPEAVPVPGLVLAIAHVSPWIHWIPAPLVDPEKELPVCVRVMENEPPSLITHPFDVVNDHAHVPTHVPVRGNGNSLLKVANILLSLSIVSVSGVPPALSPLKPTKTEPSSGVAVSVTSVPDA